MARGELRVYLGAAPGAGVTVAMLEEGRRRLAGGDDVVVAVVNTHGREHTSRSLHGLAAVAPVWVPAKGGPVQELDLDAVLQRRPEVVLVDELARRSAPGSGAVAGRWRDVEILLEAGLDVITTVTVAQLESLSDVVEQILGVAVPETVPDAFVRGATQIELVDITPEALRRRMAHGNIYPAERIDAALANSFRIENLTALRQLALAWTAQVVGDALEAYRRQQGLDALVPVCERVVVALGGGPEGERLIRRAARLAHGSAAGLVAVHVQRRDGRSGRGVAALTGQRALVEALGGEYHSVLGDRVPQALLEFAGRAGATQLVLGAPRRPGPVAARVGTVAEVCRRAGAMDVHLVRRERARGNVELPQLGGGLTRRRRLAGAGAAIVLLPALTAVCSAARGSIGFAADVSLFLLAVVVTSLIGGFYPALVSALAAGLLLNYFFVVPLHTLSIDDPSNLVAVLVFLLVAVAVSTAVDLAARRSVLAARAGAEADTLSAFAGSLLRGEQALPALIERVRDSFGMNAACLLVRDRDGWTRVAAAGTPVPGNPHEGDASVTVEDSMALVVGGHALDDADRRVLAALATHVVVAYRQQLLADAARAAEPLVESDRQRTALLNAVSHDLRTPIAAAKAAVSSLRVGEISWTREQRAELLVTAEDALDRLTGLVTNLLDLSRLQAGALPVLPAVIGVDDVVARALEHADPAADVVVDVPGELPEVLADAGLLERVIAKLVQNALRFAPPATTVRVTGSAHAERVELRVIDRGPGFAADVGDRLFLPFQRSDDAPADGAGVGLGLAIARGFTEAMGGRLTVEPTPGGGATLVVTLPAAAVHPREAGT